MSVPAPFHPSQLWNKCFKEVKIKLNQKSWTQPPESNMKMLRGTDTLPSHHMYETGESEASTVHTVHPVLHSEYCICCFMTETDVLFSNTQKMNWEFHRALKARCNYSYKVYVEIPPGWCAALPFIHRSSVRKAENLAPQHRRPRQTRECEIQQNLHLDEIWQPCIDLLFHLGGGLEHFSHWSNSVCLLSTCMCSHQQDTGVSVCSLHTVQDPFLFSVSEIAAAMHLSRITWHFMTFFKF